MKVLALIFTYIFFVNTALAGLPPTTLKGQSGTKATTFNFEVPANQATKTSTGQLIETGNGNLLVNPSFEHSLGFTGWQAEATSGFVSASLAPATSSSKELGLKHQTFSCEGSGGAGVCTFYQDVATAKQVQGLASIYVSSSSASGVKVYSRANQANSQSVNVTQTAEKLYKVPVILGSTHTGIAVEVTVSAGQTITGTLDHAFVGAVDLKADGPISYTQSSFIFSNSTASAANVTGTDSDPRGSGVYTYNSATGVFTLLVDAVVSIECSMQASTATAVGPVIGISGATKHISTGPATAGTRASTSYSGKHVAGTTANCIANNGASNASYLSFTATATTNTSFYSSTNADTDWQSCGHTTSDFTGFGTVTNIETQCKRQGSDLLMKGKFTAGTGAAVEARIGLKHNGSSLTSAGTSRIPSIQVAGQVALGISNTSYYSSAALQEPSVGYLTIGNQASSASALTKQNGTAFSSLVISFNTRTPINGWENSNQIIGSFAEVVTTPGISKPKHCAGTVTYTSSYAELKDYGNCISAVNTSNGIITFEAGYWTDTPVCNCTAQGANTTVRDCYISSSATFDKTTVHFQTANASTNANLTYHFNCSGY